MFSRELTKLQKPLLAWIVFFLMQSDSIVFLHECSTSSTLESPISTLQAKVDDPKQPQP
jgi:hypothetical protein